MTVCKVKENEARGGLMHYLLKWVLAWNWYHFIHFQGLVLVFFNGYMIITTILSQVSIIRPTWRQWGFLLHCKGLINTLRALCKPLIKVRKLGCDGNSFTSCILCPWAQVICCSTTALNLWFVSGNLVTS